MDFFFFNLNFLTWPYVTSYLFTHPSLNFTHETLLQGVDGSGGAVLRYQGVHFHCGVIANQYFSVLHKENFIPGKNHDISQGRTQQSISHGCFPTIRHSTFTWASPAIGVNIWCICIPWTAHSTACSLPILMNCHLWSLMSLRPGKLSNKSSTGVTGPHFHQICYLCYVALWSHLSLSFATMTELSLPAAEQLQLCRYQTEVFGFHVPHLDLENLLLKR